MDEELDEFIDRKQCKDDKYHDYIHLDNDIIIEKQNTRWLLKNYSCKNCYAFKLAASRIG